MGFMRSALVGISTLMLLRAGVAAPPAEPPSPASRYADEPMPPRTFDRLIEIIKQYTTIVDRLNRERGRAQSPKLLVSFGWLIGGDDIEWPNDFAPRAEFVKLADAAIDDLKAKGVLAALADIARAPSIAYSDRAVENAGVEFPHACRDFFRVYRYLIDRSAATEDWAGVADHVVTLLGLSRLLTGTNDAIVAMTGSAGTALAVAPAMALIVDHRLPADARRTLAEGLTLGMSHPDRIRAEARRWKSEIATLWNALPADLFADAESAWRAWDKLDERTQRDVAFHAFGVGQPPQFPVPSLQELGADIDDAARTAGEWIRTPKSAQSRSDALAAAARTPRERRVACSVALFVSISTTGEHLALSVAALRTAIALEDYRDRHAQYPESLDALVPDLLPEVPTDPFGAGAPLIYRRTPVTAWDKTCPYILYSRGGDGVDDGGVPTSKPGIYVKGPAGTDIILNAIH